MTALVLGIDSGLDGAFAWHCGGRIIGQLATRQFLDSERRLDFASIREWCQLVNAKVSNASRAAFLEEPFAPKGRERGVMGSWRRFGQLEALLWSLEYEVIGVRAQTWQADVLDLARFATPVTQECKPRLAEGWRLRKSTRNGHRVWLLSNDKGTWTYPMGAFGIGRETLLKTVTFNDETSGAVTMLKTVTSHDTKAASIYYVREHFPDINLVPPRAKKPHDGLADAVCIAVWGSRQIKETP